MSEKPRESSAPAEQQAGKPAHNPFILNFCRALVEKKGENHEPEALEKLLNKMYSLYEYMLGQNMVMRLPEPVRKQYLTLTEDLASLSYEKIGEFFEPNVPDYKQVMKETMHQFADIFMKNREFNTRDYPVPSDFPAEG